MAGSTLGFILRLFIRYLVRRNTLLRLNNSLIVNTLSSLFLGFFIALNVENKNLLLFIFVGFLGCFSTFSSFIYKLFNLIQKKQYMSFILNYIGFLLFSFLFFTLGYSINLIIKS